MRLSTLPQFRRNTKRFTEIVAILGRYGFAHFVRRSDPDLVQRLFKTPDGEKLSELSEEARIRMALTELGTTFIKLGQILSTRTDLVHPELAAELEKLQSHTPADPPEVARAIVERELGCPVGELFAQFEDRPLASASIGQVHAARLESGEEVVVKVQHTDIEDRVVQDLEILDALAGLAEHHDKDLRNFQPRATVAEFRRVLLRELDFGRELRNLELFAANFKNDDTIHIPAAYRDSSSRRVLTMERIDGTPLSRIEDLRARGFDSSAFARRGASAYLEMIFRDGIYHADPHPGNILVLPGGVIGLLDFGMVGRVDEVLRQDLESMLLAVFSGETEELTHSVMRLGSTPPELDRDALRSDLGEYLADYVNRDLQDLELSRALEDLTAIVRRHRILLPPSVSLLLKVLVMLEGTSRLMDRDFSLAGLIQPYTAKLASRRYGPQRMMQRARHSLRDWDRLVDRLPRELTEILDRVSSGQFHVNLQHRRLDSTVNRLVYGIITAALFLGSVQLWSREVPPILGGIPLFGVAGTVLSVLLGARLLKAIHDSDSLGKG